MKRTMAPLFLAVLVAGCATSGPPTASVVPKRPVAQAAAKPKLICRRDENVGTILPQRVCRTAANWRVEDHRTAGDTDLFISHRDNSTGLPTTKN